MYKRLLLFFSGTMLSRISGFLRDFLMAYFFGATPMTAAFFTAFRLAQLTRRMAGEGALQTAFIPEYLRIKEQESHEKAWLFYSHLKKRVFWCLLGLCLILLILTPLSLLYGPAFLSEVQLFFLFLLPTLFFLSFFGITSSYAQAEGRLGKVALSPIALNLFWCITLPFTTLLQEPYSFILLSLGINIGAFFQWWSLNRSEPVIPPPPQATPPLKKLIAPFLAGLGGVAATQINSALDPFFAAYENSASPAFLWYAFRIFQAPVGLLGVALSSTLLPLLSSLRHKKETSIAIAQKINPLFLRILGIITPLTCALFLFSSYWVSLVFGYGAFEQEESQQKMTALALSFYILGLLPQIFSLVFTSLYCAYEKNFFVMRCGVISVITNLFLNGFFIFIMGYAGIYVALATAFASILQTILLLRGPLPLPKQALFFKTGALFLLLSTFLTPLIFHHELFHPLLWTPLAILSCFFLTEGVVLRVRKRVQTQFG